MIAPRATVAMLIRSLREDSRGARTYAARFVVTGLLMLGLMQAYSMSMWMGAPGLHVFQWIAWVDLLMIILAAVSYFVTPITEEKEEQTLGLLRMTSLNALSILLGKAGTRLLATLLLLIAQLPFTLLSITLGGVGVRQIAATYATLLAFTVFASAAGLICSVYCKRSREAASLMVMTLLALLLGPWIVRGVLEAGVAQTWWAKSGAIYTDGQSITQWFIDASPFMRITQVLATGFNGVIAGYQVIANLIAAAVLYGVSWLMFERWAGAPVSEGASKKKAKQRKRKPGQRAWQAALAWKDFRFLCGGWRGVIVRFVVYAVGIGAVNAMQYWNDRNAVFDREDFGQGAMIIAMCGFCIELAAIVSRVYAEEIRERTLSSIMILPLSLPRLAYSKLGGCMISLAPVVTFFLIGAIASPDSFEDIIEEFATEIYPWFMVADALAFVHLTLLLSLYLKWGALAAAIAVMFAVHTAVGMTISLIAMTAMRGTGFDDDVLFGGFTIAAIVACAFMHPWIARRLAEQGAQ